MDGGSIAFGDVDNDGDLDLVMAGSGYFKIFKNNGAGTFNETQNLTPGISLSSIALGDIDHDGYLDIVMTGNGASRYFKTYKNIGNGFFSEHQDLAPGVQNGSLALGDINHDGDLDLIMTGYDGASYYFNSYTNNNGWFSLCQTIGPGVQDSSTALADINKDGAPDVLMSGYNGSSLYLRIYTNNGSGIFNQHQNIIPGFRNNQFACGDIDSDGDIDFAVGGSTNLLSNGPLAVYKNTGGYFTINQYLIGAMGPAYDTLAFGDIDNDGDLDLILGGFAPSTSYYFQSYTNSGNGTFYFCQDINNGSSYWPNSISLGDIDLDHDTDIAAIGQQMMSGAYSKIFRNQNTSPNTPPDIPINSIITNSNNFWRFQWSPSTDDHTPQNMLRYHIAIGTNQSGTYDYISAAIDYPRGQANIGNIPDGWLSPAQCYYQSKIPITKKAFWKVCAIDSAFKSSGFSPEQNTLPPAPVFKKCLPLSQTSLYLEWTNRYNITSCTLFRHTRDNYSEAVKISGFSPAVTIFTDKGLSTGQGYYYWIRSYNTCGISPFSLPPAYAMTAFFSSRITVPEHKGFLDRNDSITGTADSLIMSISKIQVRLKDLLSNTYWNGAMWHTSSNAWLDAADIKEWYYNTKSVKWSYGNRYSIQSRAVSTSNEIELGYNAREFTAVYDKSEKYSFCNYPNPFSPLNTKTTIEYFLNISCDVKLYIYDINHGLVKLFNFSSGQPGASTGLNRVFWDGRTDKGYFVSNGVYFCYLKTRSAERMTKIMVIK